ncbi:M48 family metallopeptidase [Candidatus Saccharibacteria bacterium]|nr:M48 family metallopeptidase [Candidatus Saccharibacteria bacterium]
MPIIHDKEFGKVTIRRSARATQVSVRLAPDGSLRATLPIYAPVLLVRYLLKNSREQLRKMISKSKPEYQIENGQQIGKSHSLIINNVTGRNFSVRRHGQQIIVSLPDTANLTDEVIARKIRDEIISALRIEAKSYLPRRLNYLANQHGFKYSKIRFSHSSSRWGSCSSNGTISLNIALMKLPFDLIDYVLLHELSHTKEMNHSRNFWRIVASIDPQYMTHRKALKLQNPSI